MARALSLAAWPLAVAALVTVPFYAPSPSTAQRRALRVAVGETSSTTPSFGPSALGEALERALDANPSLARSPIPRAALVLRGSVVRFERSRLADDLEVRCEISLIVTEARGGSIRAMLRGQAGARGGLDEARLAQNALDAAVRSALRPLADGRGSRLAAR